MCHLTVAIIFTFLLSKQELELSITVFMCPGKSIITVFMYLILTKNYSRKNVSHLVHKALFALLASFSSLCFFSCSSFFLPFSLLPFPLPLSHSPSLPCSPFFSGPLSPLSAPPSAPRLTQPCPAGGFSARASVYSLWAFARSSALGHRPGVPILGVL